MSTATLRGVLQIFFSNLIFCVMACLVKFLAGFNAYTTTLFRFMVGISLVGILAMCGKTHLTFSNGKGLFLRGLTGGVSTALVFYSISKLGLIKAGFIFNLYPIFAMLFGVLILRESMTRGKLTAAITACIGMVLLMGPRSGSDAMAFPFTRYELLALTGTILAGFTVVLIKRLQTTDSTVAIFFAQCLIGLVVVAVPASIGPHVITPGILAVLLAIGILATIGQLLMTNSYKHLSVGTGSLIVMSAPLFNATAGILLFNERLTVSMALGALIMLAASAGILLQKDQ